jgi:hypothetical protein
LGVSFGTQKELWVGLIEMTSPELIPVSVEPFLIAWQSDPKTTEEPYKRWLDPVIGIALSEWGERL